MRPCRACSVSATSGAAGRTGLRKAGLRLGTGNAEAIWVQRRPVQIEEQPGRPPCVRLAGEAPFGGCGHL